MKLVIDVDRCQGHGRCYDIAPDVVGADDEGHASLVDPSGEVAPDHEAAARKAIANCPERALSWGA